MARIRYERIFMPFSYVNSQTGFGEFVKIGPIQKSHLRRVPQVASRALVGVILLGIVTFIAFQLHFPVAATGAVYLLVVTMQSLGGDFSASVVVSVLAF